MSVHVSNFYVILYLVEAMVTGMTPSSNMQRDRMQDCSAVIFSFGSGRCAKP